MNDPAVLTSISNGFHLVHIIVVDDVVKCSVEFVEEVHHLMGGAGAWQLSEAHNITKDEQMTSEPISQIYNIHSFMNKTFKNATKQLKLNNNRSDDIVELNSSLYSS